LPLFFAFSGRNQSGVMPIPFSERRGRFFLDLAVTVLYLKGEPTEYRGGGIYSNARLL
jgi:hypothetical protein